MKIGLYFGSFNPVHTGHMIIANHVLNFTELDQIWMVISLQSPFKQRSNLIDSYDRLNLVERAIGDNDRIKPCTIEFELPTPSYTIDTLAYLKDRYPSNDFTLLMGSDNLVNFNHWKNFDIILKYYKILVYLRPGFENVPFINHPSVSSLNAPLLDISSSFIRKLIAEGKSIQYLVPEKVREEIYKSNLFKS
ncbi:MAG: nicotinate (nicotinamide) nucleotide adenylyltransferase [Deltaproteobacteria bacterium]